MEKCTGKFYLVIETLNRTTTPTFFYYGVVFTLTHLSFLVGPCDLESFLGRLFKFPQSMEMKIVISQSSLVDGRVFCFMNVYKRFLKRLSLSR